MKKIITLFLISILITGCGCSKKEVENNEEQKIEYNSVENKKVGLLDIVDFMVYYENNVSTIYFDVVNNSDEIVNYNTITYKMYNRSKNLVLTFSSDLGEMNPGDIKQIKEAFDSDLRTVTNVEYELSNK